MASSVYRLVTVASLILVIISFGSVDANVVPPMDPLFLSVNPLDAAPASNITSKALVEAKHLLRTAYENPITQADVSRHLDTLMRAEGADGALSFPTLVMSGFELTSAHGDPLDDSTHIIDPATEPVVMIDIGCKYNGHCSDVTRTFFFETVTQEMLDAYEAVLAAEEAVIAAVSPGVKISTLDAIMGTYLEDYVGVPGISLLTYWGHGVGEYVHETPILYNNAEKLVVNDVLAIEPGIYSEDGWAVRVEDTVLVTETGFEVLSDAPKSLDDVMVLQNQPYVEVDISVTNYEYGLNVAFSLLIADSANREVIEVDWSNGYSWIEMDKISESYYSISYALNYSYSGYIDCLARVHLSNDTYYFDQAVSASVEASEQIKLTPAHHLDDTIILPDSLIIMSQSQPGAEMIRIRFEVLNAGHDQFLIEESSSHVVADYRDVSDMYVWTPWVAGDTVNVHIVTTEPDYLGGVDSFSFTIDRIEYFDEDLLPTSTTTTTTSETSTTTTVTETTTTTGSTITTSGAPPPFNLGPEWINVLISGGSILLAILVIAFISSKRR
ncbi:MAG: M24 family metallopeptidase [Candidatus Thorarchaeota archaeon]